METSVLNREPETLEVDETERESSVFFDRWYPLEADDVSQSTEATQAAPSDDGMTCRMEMRAFKKRVRRSAFRPNRDGDVFRATQQFECVVIGCTDEYVECEMHDLTDPLNQPEFAEVLLSEFNEHDLPLLEEGAVFYWSIGYIRRPSGQLIRAWQLRVRRLPELSRSQMRLIEDRVREIREVLGQPLQPNECAKG